MIIIMEAFVSEIVGLCLGFGLVVGVVTYFVLKNHHEKELHALNLELTQTETMLDAVKERLLELKMNLAEIEKDYSAEKGKTNQQKEELMRIEAKMDSAARAYQALGKDKANLEEKLEAREAERQKVMTEMLQSKRGFEKEKELWHQKQEAMANQAFENKQRQWAEHENEVVAHLKQICSKPELGMTGYDNLNPPEVLGKVKPDFCVQFMGQFVVFDAKTTTAKRDGGMWAYLQANVKTTAKKYAENDKIYNAVYFVVPDLALNELKQTHIREGEYDFYFVPVGACEPILKILKKVEYYQNLKDWDPAEREGLIDLIARYDHFMNFRNTLDLLISQKSMQLMETKSQIAGESVSEIEKRKVTFKAPSIKPAEIKTLMQSAQKQHQTIQSTLSPTPKISKEMIDNTQELFRS